MGKPWEASLGECLARRGGEEGRGVLLGRRMVVLVPVCGQLEMVSGSAGHSAV